MADTSTTDHQGWVEGLDRLTKDREGQDVTIEVLDRSFGDQREVERLPFAYTSYDPKDDVVIVAVGGSSSSHPVVLRHLVPHPSEVDIDPAAGAFRVVEQDGTTTIVSFFPRSGG
ncbi:MULTISPECIES: DUF5335 family protein [unclassified Nocardioides]|uniref:DUF5335 family protein n=1 Tax=unclassified Nocardioides TaxID=2615069 RepID=UPI0009F10D39|nr:MULTISPECIES: DUF5335 family protein [unclassified Nocardioides]GAW50992.1 Putative uncharacterized protein [Nocardioides sp. PD653-B2]GAW56281.1 putative uncharacterized protein [Nocardioides sp. PD653]